LELTRFTTAKSLAANELASRRCRHRSLKYEIESWSREALQPYVFLRKRSRAALDEDSLQELPDNRGLYVFRMSRKVGGELPFRLVANDDVNPYLAAHGRPELGPDRVLVSRTLASRFGLSPGDRMLIRTGAERYRFLITEVADDLGFYADDGPYVDLKSWFVFGNGGPLFADAVEPMLGDVAAVRKRGGGRPTEADMEALRPNYRVVGRGWDMGRWQQQEIDRDFLIFDFILIMTVILAAVGVANSILIQVYARERELSVLRTVGVSRGQTARLLSVEATVIGMVGAVLSLVLGHTVGAISVAFLDRFTLFDYQFVVSVRAGLWIALLAVATCCVAAIYPALVADRISSAESLHYE
jgi:putative ABC transport system permease protein